MIHPSTVSIPSKPFHSVFFNLHRNHIMIRQLTANCRTLLLLLCTLLPAVAVETVTGIYPASCIANTATTVVITGTNFTGTPVVTIAGVTATGVTVNSATQLTASITIPTVPVSPTRGAVVVGGGTLSAAFTVRETNTINVQVIITCNIGQILALCWTGNTTGKSEGATSAVAWSMPNLAISAIRDTNTAAANTDALDFEVRNVGNSPAHITVGTASSTNWTLAAAPSVDGFALAVNNGANAAAAWLNLNTTQTLNAGATVAANATAAFDLQFSAPTWSTTIASQTIAVTITAAP